MAEHTIDINLDKCRRHEEVVSQLSPLFSVLAGDSVKIKLTVTKFTYPDFLVLVTAALRKLDEINVTPDGEIEIDDKTSGYISRMNFFQNLNVKFEEQFQRQDNNGRFIEITNFDGESDYLMVDKVVQMLQRYTSIDQSVMYLISFCLGEVVGNIFFHAESKNGGWITAQYYAKHNKIRIVVCDTGCGVHHSLKTNQKYAAWTEAEALEKCIENKVTNGKGMGFGLYATANFAKLNKGELLIYSGDNCLTSNRHGIKVSSGNKWQGTFVYLEINTDISVQPELVTDGYTDFIDSFKERYEEGGINGLW
ncbi:ATP-binding protein [Mucilaginibacter sp. CSA2-8R]|uniref:ATP-binding protein n=1 Tax=Mucilaginibacter sp. CSA2-8R TaxID=3141542 RepID=UPI00315DD215